MFSASPFSLLLGIAKQPPNIRIRRKGEHVLKLAARILCVILLLSDCSRLILDVEDYLSVIIEIIKGLWQPQRVSCSIESNMKTLSIQFHSPSLEIGTLQAWVDLLLISVLHVSFLWLGVGCQFMPSCACRSRMLTSYQNVIHMTFTVSLNTCISVPNFTYNTYSHTVN